MAKIAKSILADPITETIDLAKVTPARGQELINLAFKEPFSLANQIRLTFVVGAGKAARQKYDHGLTKILCAALEKLGFDQDPGASCVNSCQGKFKHQHDTGQNLMYLHVFPRLSAAAIPAAVAGISEEDAKPTQEDQMASTSLKDFEDILRRHCDTWLQRKRCLTALENLDSRLQSIEDKMCLSQLLSAQEQRLYGESDRDLIKDKMKAAIAGMKALVQSDNLDGNSKVYLLEQIENKISKIQNLTQPKTAEAVEAAASSPAPPAPQLSTKQMAAAKKRIGALKARRDVVKSISATSLPLMHEKDMAGVWRNVLKLGKDKKDSSEQRKHFNDLAQSSQRWLETDEELEARVAKLKARCKVRKAGGGGKKTGGKKKKKSSGRAPGTGSRSRKKD